MKKSVFFLIYLAFPSYSFGWFFDKPNINELSVRFFMDNCSDPNDKKYFYADKYLSPCSAQRAGAGMGSAFGGRKIQVDIKNNTKYFIKSIKAKCQVYDKNKNRIFSQDVILKDNPVEIAPNNSGIFYYIDSKLPFSVISVECEIIEAEGSKN